MEDGGRLGDQVQALLLLLAKRVVASGYIKSPPSWNTLGTAALVSLTVRRWQQRLSAWLHVKTARLLLRQSSPVGIYLQGLISYNNFRFPLSFITTFTALLSSYSYASLSLL